MILGTWILIVATHVNAGASVAMQEFGTREACEIAATATRQVAEDAAGNFSARPRTWCVPKGEQTK